MRFLVIETFRGGDAVPVYRRFRDQGRLARPSHHVDAACGRNSGTTNDVRRETWSWTNERAS